MERQRIAEVREEIAELDLHRLRIRDGHRATMTAIQAGTAQAADYAENNRLVVEIARSMVSLADLQLELASLTRPAAGQPAEA